MNKKLSLIFILIFIQTLGLAANMGRGNHKSRANYVLESFEEYEFRACEKFNKEDDFDYFLSCQFGEIVVNDNLSGLQKDINAINTSYYKKNLLDHIKEDSLLSLTEQQKNISRILDCFVNKSNHCAHIRDELLSRTKTDLKEMRQFLIQSNGPSFFSSNKDQHLFNRKIEHHVKDQEIPAITKSELQEVTEREKFIHFSLEQDWFKKNEKNSKCITKNKSGTYSFNSKKQSGFNCEAIFRNAMNNNKKSEVEKIREESKKEYFNILNRSPILSSLNLSGEESDAVVQTRLKSNLIEMQKNIQSSINRIKGLKPSEQYKLLSNKNIVENYLTRQGPPHFLCDIAQEFKDDIFYDELATDLLIAGGALVGGGVCALTAGLGCVLGVAVAGEALSIGLSHQRNAAEELLFNTGLSEVLELKEKEDDLTLTLAIAPLALGGEFLGKGVKHGAKLLKASNDTSKELGPGAEDLLTKYQKTKFFDNTATKVVKPKSINDLIHEYERFTLTTPSLNRRWIQSAKSKESAFFLDVENAALKRLNDTLGNKNFVTALTNIHKDLFAKKTFEILKRYPDVNFEVYSDFKSVRFAFMPKEIPAQMKDALTKELNEAFKETNQEFSNMIKDIVTLPEGEHPEKWFAAGVSQTADEAGLAAKKSRNLDREKNEIVSFSSVQKSVQEEIDDISRFQQKVGNNEKLKQAGLVSKIEGTNQHTLSEEFIDLIRKTPMAPKPEDLAKLKEKISIQYGQNLSTNEVANLNNYVHKLNDLTPGLWLPKREIANLDGAVFGGITGDVTGMGSTNIRQVALDIAQAQKRNGNTSQVIASIRQGEQIVTENFNRIKKNFEETIRDVLQTKGIGHAVKCSGDDCAVIISETISLADQIDIIKAFSKQTNPSQYRMSFVPANAPLKSQTNIAVHGELIEKELRQSLKGLGDGHIPASELKKIAFGLSMPNQLGQGSVELIIGNSKDLNLSTQQLALIEVKFRQAVKKINEELTRTVQNEADRAQVFDYSQGLIHQVK